MDSALLLLADSRLPAGGHVHSGGLEPAVTAGTVTDEGTLAAFLAGRLATTGLVTASLAASACHLTTPTPASRTLKTGKGSERETAGRDPKTLRHNWGSWEALDGEADARTPSAAQRAASRAQGRGLVRVARAAWPSPLFADPALARRDGPHHPVALGACVHVAGGGAYDAALLAATASVTGPATAGLRMLGLDPMGVQSVLAALANEIDAVATQAAAIAGSANLKATGATSPVHAADADESADPSGPARPLGAFDLAALPAVSAPLLDILAEHHLTQEVRLFES